MNSIQEKWRRREEHNSRSEKNAKYFVELCKKESLPYDVDPAKIRVSIEEEDANLRARFLFLEKEFGLCESDLKTFVEPNNEIFACSETELRVRVPYFINLFQGIENFMKLLNNNGYRFFKLKKVEQIPARLVNLEKIFQTDRQGVINLVAAADYYLKQSSEKILGRIENIATKQRLDYDECISLLKKYPQIYSWYAENIAIAIKEWRLLCNPTNVSSNDVRVQVNIITKKNTDEPNTIILSSRLLKSGAFSSTQMHEFGIQTHNTRLGCEYFTCDIPNVECKELQQLDEDGIVRNGAIVREGEILVGKVTPISESSIEFTNKERLIYSIFGEKRKKIKIHHCVYRIKSVAGLLTSRKPSSQIDMKL